MKIILKNKNISPDAKTEKYLEKKLESLKKFLKNFNQEILLVEAELERTVSRQRKGDVFRAEINLSVGGGKIFRVESQQSVLWSAIDEARDDLEREIKKFKTKNETVFIRGARSITKKLRLSPLARFKNRN